MDNRRIKKAAPSATNRQDSRAGNIIFCNALFPPSFYHPYKPGSSVNCPHYYKEYHMIPSLPALPTIVNHKKYKDLYSYAVGCTNTDESENPYQ